MRRPRQLRQQLEFESNSSRASSSASSAVHRIGQALQRGVEGCSLLGETKTHDRRHGVLFIECRLRDRRYLVVGHDALAERLVGFAKPERGKVDREEIGALRAKNREADALQSRGEAVAAPRQLFAHLIEIIRRLAEAVGDRRLEIGGGGEGKKLVHLGSDAQQRRRRADKADLQARQRKNLASGTYLDG